MSKTTTTTTQPLPDQPCTGCADKSGPCADCADSSVDAVDQQPEPTPSAGGRYKRAEDGTLTPLED